MRNQIRDALNKHVGKFLECHTGQEKELLRFLADICDHEANIDRAYVYGYGSNYPRTYFQEKARVFYAVTKERANVYLTLIRNLIAYINMANASQPREIKLFQSDRIIVDKVEAQMENTTMRITEKGYTMKRYEKFKCPVVAVL